MPLAYVRNLNGCKLISLPHSIFAGVVGEHKYIKLLLQTAFNLSKKLNCDLILVKQPPNNTYDKIIKDSCMVKGNDRLNQYLFLEDPNILWDKLHRSCQYSIKKAEKNDVTIRLADNKKDIDRIYKLILLLNKRLGLSPPNKKYLINLWSYLYSKDYLKIFLAEQDKKILSYDIFLSFKQRMLGISNGPTDIGRKLCANHLLLWEAIKWGYKKDYKIFDLGSTPNYFKNGCTNKSDGLFKFKKYFSCTNARYSYFYYPDSINPNEDDKTGIVYNLGRKFFKIAPICASKRIGPIACRLFYE